MIRLITKLDLPYGVSKNNADDKINECIENAQLFDLKPLLGVNMYNDMVATIGAYQLLPQGSTADEKTQLYLNLFKGATYGIPSVDFYGLKKCLSYYTYARILRTGDMHATPSGNAFKTNEWSERPSFKAVDEAANNAESTAYGFWLETASYLKTFSKFYPYYDTAVCQPKAKHKPSSLIFSAVSSEWQQRNRPVQREPAQPYTEPNTVEVYYGYWAEGDEPEYQFIKNVPAGALDFSLDFPAEAADMFIGFSELATQPLKNVYFNTAENMGTIPDQVFLEPVLVGDRRETATSNPFEMQIESTTINFSYNAI